MGSYRAVPWHQFLPQYVKLVRPYRRQLAIVLVFILAMQVFALGEPILLKFIIDALTLRTVGTEIPAIWIALGAFVAYSSIGAIQIPKNKRIRSLWQQINRDVPLWCAEKLLRLQMDYHQSHHAEALISKVMKGVGRLCDVTAFLSFEIVPLVVQTLLTAAIITSLEWRATCILLVVVTSFVLLTFYIKKRMAPVRCERYDVDERADQEWGQAVRHASAVQAFRKEAWELARIRDRREQAYALEQEEYHYNERMEYWRNALVSAGRSLIMFVCLLAINGHRMETGSFLLVMILAERVFVSCYRIGSLIDRLTEASESISRIAQLMEEPVQIEDPKDPLPLPKRLSGGIEFMGVTYAYPHRTRMRESERALDRIDLFIRPGEMIGLVGSSGAGKTTLTKLLLRYVDPQEGQVRLDGMDLRRLPLDFRGQIGYVMQDPMIFDRTIAENIAFGKPGATPQEIQRAAEIACLHGFIQSLPQGYETLVGNNGITLSGGQRQRLAIARAVLINPPILIFDEATSHVDVLTEGEIQEALERLRHGRTMIVIAHRLTTVKRANRIVVLERGRIEEVGSPSDLLHHDGLYHKLVSIQAEQAAT